jgi:phage-related holin
LFGSIFRPAYGIVGLLWVIDTATGYYHAWANPAVKPESRRMYHGIVKVAIYYFLMFLGYQIGRCGVDMMVMIQTVIEMAIILTESKSVLENLDKINTLKGWNIPLISQLLALVEGRLNQAMDAEPHHGRHE